MKADQIQLRPGLLHGNGARHLAHAGRLSLAVLVLAGVSTCLTWAVASLLLSASPSPRVSNALRWIVWSAVAPTVTWGIGSGRLGGSTAGLAAALVGGFMGVNLTLMLRAVVWGLSSALLRIWGFIGTFMVAPIAASLAGGFMTGVKARPDGSSRWAQRFGLDGVFSTGYVSAAAATMSWAWVSLTDDVGSYTIPGYLWMLGSWVVIAGLLGVVGGMAGLCGARMGRAVSSRRARRLRSG